MFVLHLAQQNLLFYCCHARLTWISVQISNDVNQSGVTSTNIAFKVHSVAKTCTFFSVFLLLFFCFCVVAPHLQQLLSLSLLLVFISYTCSLFFFPLFSSRCSHYYSHTHHQSSQHTRYCIPPPLSLSAAVCVSVHACVISCSAMACTGSEESLWMVSFNQIVLQIGEDEDGRRGAVRDTCHSPFHSCLI